MDDPRPLVDELATALPFRREEQLITLLRYLAKHSYPHNNAEARTAEAVALALEWSDKNVWATARRLRQELDKYNRTTGKGAPYQIRLGAGGRHAVSVGENYRVTIEGKGPRLSKAFWRPHLDRGDVTLATNAPLFYRHRDGEYRIRVMSVNDEVSYEAHVKNAGRPDLATCEACFHYISIGDFRMSVKLVAFFLAEQTNVECKIAYSSNEWEDPFNVTDELELRRINNLVALGNPRVSWVIRDMQRHIEPCFHIPGRDIRAIRLRSQKDGEKAQYEDKLVVDGELYAAVVRKVTDARAFTLISIQNGPALQALANLLTDDAALEHVLQTTHWKCFPNYFELLFRVPLGLQETPRAPELIAWRDRHWKDEPPRPVRTKGVGG